MSNYHDARVTHHCFECLKALYGGRDGIIYYRMGKNNNPLCQSCWEHKRSMQQ